MKRTTIMAPEELLNRLQSIAREEDTSLAEIIRQALEWRATQGGRRPRFIGSGQSEEPPHDMGRRSSDITYTPRSWR
jgi:hypothetical protein